MNVRVSSCPKKSNSSTVLRLESTVGSISISSCTLIVWICTMAPYLFPSMNLGAIISNVENICFATFARSFYSECSVSSYPVLLIKTSDGQSIFSMPEVAYSYFSAFQQWSILHCGIQDVRIEFFGVSRKPFRLIQSAQLPRQSPIHIINRRLHFNNSSKMDFKKTLEVFRNHSSVGGTFDPGTITP